MARLSGKIYGPYRPKEMRPVMSEVSRLAAITSHQPVGIRSDKLRLGRGYPEEESVVDDKGDVARRGEGRGTNIEVVLLRWEGWREMRILFIADLVGVQVFPLTFRSGKDVAWC